MASDASIYGQIRPVQAPEGPLDQYGRALTLARLQDQGELAGLQREQVRRSLAKEGRLAQIAQQYGNDEEGLATALQREGMFGEANTIRSNAATRAKTKAEAQKIDVETELKKTELLTDLAARVQDDAGMGMLRQQAVRLYGEAALTQIPERYDPNWQRNFVMKGADRIKALTPNPVEQSNGAEKYFVDNNPSSPTFGQRIGAPAVTMQMTPGERATDERAAATAAEIARHNREMERNSAANVAIARERLGLDRTAQDRADWQWDSDRGGFANRRTNEFKPAVDETGKPLGPKDKNMTEGQAKANVFGTRMQEADRILNEAATEGVFNSGWINRTTRGAVEWMPGIGRPLGNAADAATNWTQSATQQKVEQAKRDFLNAVLRKESGALISDEEFANGDKQYFPQPGDKPEKIEQKARNRQTAIQTILAEVPEGKRTRIEPPKQAGPKPPKKGDVQDGWRFKGGDPADRANWEKA